MIGEIAEVVGIIGGIWILSDVLACLIVMRHETRIMIQVLWNVCFNERSIGVLLVDDPARITTPFIMVHVNGVAVSRLVYTETVVHDVVFVGDIERMKKNPLDGGIHTKMLWLAPIPFFLSCAMHRYLDKKEKLVMDLIKL